MSLFTGVSVITDGKHCTTSAVDTDTNSGYHLLVVKDYLRTLQEIHNGEAITSGPFMIGGHHWCIHYCPNGYEQSSTDYISCYICLCDVDTEEAVKVHVGFSFVDQVEYQKPMCIRASEPRSFSTKFYSWGSENFMKRDALERSTHLKDNCFTIRCDIMVCKDPNTQDVGATMSDIGQHLDYLLQNKVGADVTFEVSGETFPAHRCVLAARSTVFMAQLFGPMKEGTTSSVIQIKDMEAKVFKDLLSFIYTGSCLDLEEDGKEEEDVERVMWLHDLFVAADMYDLPRLKFLCEEHLSEHIGVSSVASTLALAEQHHCRKLRETCLKFIQVQSPPCLEKVMATGGWEHITTTYPSVLNELIAKLASNQKDNKRKR
ncbi:BTB/POZ and MATH domain-containing protein 2-like [Lolium perenne]|uniref:BTB/POZ and MATH domain-containing protein 2-like n=1 Tax=Lolium perenne TaxID=4522 RepID=UPI0021F6984E|nr:BTB/POZ and MATH domain-containing protein 2-like [Lolium perenne]XP_051223492.1 BTB/POZ and MATH domain-containing protein 2-like [Lolium perenne]XP_051223493.1 BTB/POZ and MATH domain-containing protein 2-like [Lolium perenne]XP_051223494.1 BTB/POZ and MATH domain-containing protein 2-like [Lolium perenne]XP_051223495.1 BTB/POZ and MATH domain-containing protein 2-like [Lolium perenne]